ITGPGSDCGSPGPRTGSASKPSRIGLRKLLVRGPARRVCMFSASARRRTVGGQRSRAPGSTIPSHATWPGSSEGIGRMRMNNGIIGCGMMGQDHQPNNALLPDVGAAAIVEPDDAMRGLAAAAAPDAKLVGSIEELLAVDAVSCLL